MSALGGSEVIKSFLVGLGFGVDDASLAKFNRSIALASLKVGALYASTKLAATGIVAGIAKVSEGFEQMGYEYHIIAPAINKALVLRQELLKSYSLAGINIRKVVKDSINLNLSLTKTKFAFEAIYKSVASRFFERLTKQSDLFRDKIYANMPKIQKALEGFVNFVFKALDITNDLGARLWSILGRVYDFFVELDSITGGWSTKILAAVAAWKFLNLSFIATPLGAIITGLITILALFDDFKTFQEGGESFFNWAPFIPVINAVANQFANLKKELTDLFSGNFGALLGDWLNNLSGILNILSAIGEWLVRISGLGNSFDKVVNKLSDLGAGALNVFKGGGAPLAALQAPTPAISPSVANSSSMNNNVQLQTNVTIGNAADAQGTGRAVGTAVNRSNQDFVRNFTSSIRSGGQFSTPVNGQ
jgi:hypothetical protein